MAVYRCLGLLVLSLTITGCCSYWREHPTVTAASGQKLCARHKTPLLTVHGYGTRNYAAAREVSLIHTFGPQLEREQCNPNYIPRDQALKRSRDYPISIPVTYCRECEKATAVSEAEWRAYFRKRGMSEREIERLLAKMI
jgi:hypothetical protein